METVTVKSDSGKTFEVGLIQEEYRMGYTAKKTLTVPCYDERYVYVLAEDIKKRIVDEFDSILMCTGERRTGKTTLCSQIAKTIDSSFLVDSMTFRLKDFNKVLHDNPYADTKNGIYPQVVLDEAGFDLFSQNWMERMQRNMVKKFEVIGAKNQTVYLVLPHREMLNKKLREGMAQFWINTETPGGKRGLVELRRGVPNKWQMERYWAPHAAFTFTDLKGDPWWEKYSVKKRAFIDEVTGDTEDDDEITTKNWRKEFALYLYATTGMSHAGVAEAIGVPHSTISYDLKGVKKKG